MKLTRRESSLLRRALDNATTPAEAETAAKAFFASLRERGVDSYGIVAPGAENAPHKPPEAPTPQPAAPQPQSDPMWWQAQAAQAQASRADWEAFAQAAAQAQQNYRPQDYQNTFGQTDTPPPSPPPPPVEEKPLGGWAWALCLLVGAMVGMGWLALGPEHCALSLSGQDRPIPVQK